MDTTKLQAALLKAAQLELASHLDVPAPQRVIPQLAREARIDPDSWLTIATLMFDDEKILGIQIVLSSAEARNQDAIEAKARAAVMDLLNLAAQYMRLAKG